MHATLWFCVPEIGERIIAGDSRKDIEGRSEASDASVSVVSLAVRGTEGGLSVGCGSGCG